ncbi:MAG: hypothetical protein A4E23_00559 [Methanomethylovorans sp. PtaU1.Bin073]|nr:MAG: hypothetical protein A4E23_00559 [Methanomethylovorans sp. PtaU1.Bin073]
MFLRSIPLGSYGDNTGDAMAMNTKMQSIAMDTSIDLRSAALQSVSFCNIRVIIDLFFMKSTVPYARINIGIKDIH